MAASEEWLATSLLSVADAFRDRLRRVRPRRFVGREHLLGLRLQGARVWVVPGHQDLADEWHLEALLAFLKACQGPVLGGVVADASSLCVDGEHVFSHPT